MFKAASGAVYRGVKAQAPSALQSFNAGLQYSLVPLGAAGSGTPTFTRATTAYQTDFEGKQNAVLSGEARFQGARRVQNSLPTTSEVITNAAWTKISDGVTAIPSVNASPVDGPNGALNGYAVTFPAVSGAAKYSELQAGNVTNVSGNKYLSSVFLRNRAGASTIYLFLYIGTYVSVTALSVTTSWQRFALPVSTAASSGASPGVILGCDTNNAGMAGGIAAQTVDVAMGMVEDVTGQTNQNPSEYVSVGVLSAPYYGAGIDGVQYFNYLNGNTVSSNVVTQAHGLPIVAGQSGVSASAPVDALGPMGEIDELAATQYLGVTGTPATQTTASLGTGKYCLWVVGSGSATSSAGTATLTGAGAATAASPNVFTVTGAGTVTVTVAGTVTFFQLEGGGFRTTRIDNAGVAGTTVTRIKDVTQYVSAGNIAATMSGTIQVAPEQTFGTFTGYIFGTYVDANNSTSVLFDGTNLIARKRIAGTNHDATIAWTPTANTVAKVGFRFDGANGCDVWLNGTKGTNNSTTTAAQIGTNFQIGADGNSANQDDCMHRFFNAYPTSLSDAKMAALTT